MFEKEEVFEKVLAKRKLLRRVRVRTSCLDVKMFCFAPVELVSVICRGELEFGCVKEKGFDSRVVSKSSRGC